MFFIQRLDGLLEKVEKWLLIFFCLCLTLIMVAQVIMRYFLNSPIFWAEEISAQFLIFITIFGLSFLTRKQQHICIDFVLNMTQGHFKQCIQIVLGVCFLGLIIFLCYYSWDWISRPDVQTEMSGTTGLPKWYNYASFPIALTFMAIHQLVNLLNILGSTAKQGAAC